MASPPSHFRDGLKKLEQDIATSVLLRTYNTLQGSLMDIETIFTACEMTDKYVKELVKKKIYVKQLSKTSAKLGLRLSSLVGMTDDLLTDTSMILEDIEDNKNLEPPRFFLPTNDETPSSVDEESEYEKFKKFMSKYVENKDNVKHTIPSTEEQSELLNEIAESSGHSAFILSSNSSMSVMSNKEEEKNFNS